MYLENLFKCTFQKRQTSVLFLVNCFNQIGLIPMKLNF